MVMSLYPATQKNPKLAQNVVQLLDVGMGGSEGVAEGEEQNVFAPDIETQQLLRYAQQHYPNTQGKQQAFVKFVQRALNHSEEDDMEQDEKIEQLEKAIKQLDAKVSQVTESEDYLEEK
jgi:hypothetical protein